MKVLAPPTDSLSSPLKPGVSPVAAYALNSCENKKQGLRIASVNLNGIRAAAKKGFLDWIDASDPDILLLQETRACYKDVSAILPKYRIALTEHFKKGYAGACIASKLDFNAESLTHDSQSDIYNIADEKDIADKPDFDLVQPYDLNKLNAYIGRYIEADFGTFVASSVYAPAGELGTSRMNDKWRFYNWFKGVFAGTKIIAGDYNTCHTQKDIKNWKANEIRAGFLPDERKYLDIYFKDFIDAGRLAAGDYNGPYTWWSMRGSAFDTDAGWRIDYHAISPGLTPIAYYVDRAKTYLTRFSDHAPVVVDYDIKL